MVLAQSQIVASYDGIVILDKHNSTFGSQRKKNRKKESKKNEMDEMNCSFETRWIDKYKHAHTKESKNTRNMWCVPTHF